MSRGCRLSASFGSVRVRPASIPSGRRRIKTREGTPGLHHPLNTRLARCYHRNHAAKTSISQVQGAITVPTYSCGADELIWQHPRMLQLSSQFPLQREQPTTRMNNQPTMRIEPLTVSEADVAELLSGAAPPPHEPTEVGRPPRLRRRPREPLPLTEEDLKLPADELQRLRNRMSAQRARDRAKERTADLEDMVLELWHRVQYLEAMIMALRPDLTELYDNYTPVPHDQNGVQRPDGAKLEWVLYGDA